MSASPTARADLVVIGGGVAGLWMAAGALRAGYSCVVVEREALGGGQTVASQGIIHGGIKYALGGAASRAARAIAEMPGVWRACLRGEGELDLRAVRVLSERQYLWTTAGIGSRLVGVAASKAIRTGVEKVPDSARPDGLRGAGRGVDVYAVEEVVLDPRSVLEALARDVTERGGVMVRGEVVSVDVEGVEIARNESEERKTNSEKKKARIVVPMVVLAAGAGNDGLAAMAMRGRVDVRLPSPRPLPQGGGVGQLRPLHMVMVRGAERGGGLPEVFGHCVGLSDKPRVTITTQRDAGGRTVWYVGGQIAEDGVSRGREEQIAAAKRELGACVPWVDLAGTQWATLRIDRAEGLTGDGSRPDEPVLREIAPGVLAAWPTKLAFAPLLAGRVLGRLGSPAPSDLTGLAAWAKPPMATLPWESATW